MSKSPLFTLDQLTHAQQAEVAKQLHYKKGASVTLPDGANAVCIASTTPKKRLRQKEGDGMNKTERAFFEYAKSKWPGCTVYAQDITLRLGNGVRYTPDFMMSGPSTTFFEVKGFMRDDAAVKIKVAARTFKCFRFFLVTKAKGGNWDLQEINP